MKTITYDETQWKLVPIEPTYEMADAARHFALPAIMIDSFAARERLMFSAQYRAALSAAPEPPAQPAVRDWPEPPADERCEGGLDTCGPVEHYDAEQIPLCAKCWAELQAEAVWPKGGS